MSVQVLPEADAKAELEAQEIYWGKSIRKINREGSWKRQGSPGTAGQMRCLWRSRRKQWADRTSDRLKL